MRALIHRTSLLPIALAAGAIGISACNPTFTVPAESEVTVPGSQIVGQNPLAPEQVLPANFGQVLSEQLAQSFSTEGVDSSAIQSASISSLRVTVKDPEEGGRQIRDLGFLNSLRFSLGAGEFEPTLVASSAPGAFADDPIQYDFELTGAQLAPYLESGEDLVISGEVETNSTPTFATTLLFEVEMTVVADVLGAVL